DAFLNLARNDVDIPKAAPRELLLDLHTRFISNYEKNKDSYEYITAEYLRMSGIYWCLNAMDIMGRLSQMDIVAIVNYVKGCQQQNGGFAPAIGHDAHLLHTLSAVQILIMLNKLEEIDANGVAKYVIARQNPDGSFGGDESNEIDTRFSFCAIATLYLIVYCCLGSLAITGRLEQIDIDRTGRWLAERQCRSGGLNGRPEKLPDVCYSWWVLASLAIIGRIYWIDQDLMKKFILACQDEDGGFADRPGDVADPFHTVFGLAGLSLLGDPSLSSVDAVLCMTKRSLSTLAIC
uniref:Geranylgeranyl transferase type-2 subunit beta n=1 Tax=Parascaris univalens TaxID=6257 RepID=A0A915C8M2_PARUN